MQTPLTLFKHKLIRTRANDTHGLTSVFDTSNFHDLGARLVSFLHQLCGTELVLGEGLNVGHGLGTGGLGNEVDFVSLNVLDDKDLELGKEVKGKIGDGVAEDRFLNEEDITTCLLDTLAEVEKILSLFLQDLIHLSVVVNYDLVIHLQTS